ncbi:4'-phosphopantetheinyl transferase family protein [Streptacidiphilus sp. PAMC 29251]
MKDARQRRPSRTTAPLSLGEEELDLWFLGPPGFLGPPDSEAGQRALVDAELGADELQRAAGFLRERDRLQYLTAHIALRRLLSAYTGIAPAQLRLGRDTCPGCGGPHGRPVLLNGPGGPHFSLSHSRGLVLIAVAPLPVGIDVQGRPSAETADLCMPSLHPAERRELAETTAEERSLAFGRIWTRKEAYLKGIGTGLTHGANTDYLGEHEASERPGGWTVRNLPVCPSHVAAAAVPTDRDHAAHIHGLPLDLLSVADATEQLAAAKPVVRTVLRATGKQPID